MTTTTKRDASSNGKPKYKEGLFAVGNTGRMPFAPVHDFDCNCPSCCVKWREVAIAEVHALRSALAESERKREALAVALALFCRLCPSGEGLGGHAPRGAFYAAARAARAALAANAGGAK